MREPSAVGTQAFFARSVLCFIIIELTWSQICIKFAFILLPLAICDGKAMTNNFAQS